MGRDVFDREQVMEIVTRVVREVREAKCPEARQADMWKQLERTVGQMRAELSDTGPGHVLAVLPDAAAELDAIVQTTEEAANIIMEECEAIRKKMGGAAVGPHIARILEACSFQDLTGQRAGKIRRVVDAAQARTQKIADILRARFADLDSLDAATSGGMEPHGGGLLAGPALPGQGLSQEEIDKLLDNL